MKGRTEKTEKSTRQCNSIRNNVLIQIDERNDNKNDYQKSIDEKLKGETVPGKKSREKESREEFNGWVSY